MTWRLTEYWLDVRTPRARPRVPEETWLDSACDAVLALAAAVGVVALIGHYTADGGFLDPDMRNSAWMAVSAYLVRGSRISW